MGQWEEAGIVSNWGEKSTPNRKILPPQHTHTRHLKIQGDQPGDCCQDPGSRSFAGRHCSKRSSGAPGRHAPRG